MPIEILPDGADRRIRMTQGAIALEPPLPGPAVQRIREALGVAADDLDPDLPMQVASTGHSKVMIPLRSHRSLDALAPDLPALAALSGELGCNGYFAFTFDQPDPDALTQARMFAPAIGIPEDPVTGNGNGPLGAYLVHHDRAAHDGRTFAFRGAQGDRTGRSGFVDVEVALEQGVPVRVSITGDAVIVFRAELEL
jgi:PhzF family phenazine biosynthesis protein